MVITTRDVHVAAPGMPFAFTRTYNSQSEIDGPIGPLFVAWSETTGITAAERSGWHEKRGRCETDRPHIRRGIGMASMLHVGGGAKDAYTGYKQSILKDFRFVQLGETTLAGAAKLAMDALK